MITPNKIYLTHVDEVVWNDDPAPGIGMKPDDAVEYIRTDKVVEALTANHKSHGYVDEDGGYKMLYLEEAIEAVKNVRQYG